MVGGAPAGSDPARDLYKIYQRFCAFGKGHRVAAHQLPMDSRTFVKFCKDAGILSKRLTRTSVDLIFTKVKERGQRTIDFNGFLECLRHCAVERKVTFDALVTYILRSQVGPTLASTTRVESVRFHDDTSSYTGVHARGGPTTIGGGGDGAVISLENLMDRSAYDVRGRKITPQRSGRSPVRSAAQTNQRRLSNHGQDMLNAAMAGASPGPSAARAAAAQRQRQVQQQMQMQQQQQVQQQQMQMQQRPQTSPAKGAGNIFDRLTDSSQYTGAHKHRFDAQGRGRGLQGRDRTAVGAGYVGTGVMYGGPKSTQKQYTGSTNTNTNQVFHDSSQFLMRR